MRPLIVLAIFLAFVVPAAPAFAAPQDAVLNKEGYWAIDVDNGACAASMTLQGGAIFLLRGEKGRVTFGLFGSKPLPRGKAGRIETEAYGFDFQPSYGEDATTLYYSGDLDDRALAALRLARQARILIDGRAVTAMTLEGTGFEGALDGLVACSKGEAGWWGKGVGAESAKIAGPPGDDSLVYHADGVWGIVTEGPSCVAQAAAPGGRFLQLLSVAGRVGLGVGSTGERLPKARKVRVETDSYRFEVKAEYDKDALYMSSADLLDSADAFAIRRAKGIRMTADGRDVVDVALEGDTFAEIMDAVMACSRGEKGWWGEGAKPAR